MKGWIWLSVAGVMVLAFSGCSPESSTGVSSQQKTVAPTFTAPPQPLPNSGQMGAGQYGSAPLRITTRNDGYHYLVKITSPGSTVPVSEFFIRGGETVESQLPLGTYELKYASGKTWFGTIHLFGPETSYSKAESLFEFVDNGDHIRGYTVELYTQANGNLHTAEIPASQF
jgi:hypothetical protein